MSTKTLIKLSLMGLLAFSFASATGYAKAADDDDAEEEAPKKKKKAKKGKKKAPEAKRMFVAINKFENKSGAPDGLFETIRARVQQCVARWRKAHPEIPIDYYDERFTSVLAHQAMLDGGLRKKARQDKALVDEISATIILEDYLRSRK